jgi:AMIN domain
MMRSIYVVVLIVATAGSLVQAMPPAKPVAILQSVTVTSNAGGINVEIAASEPVSPRSQVIADPDRLILEFSNSQPAPNLRSKLLNQGDIKGFRVARFSANPPVTRVVIDLNRPQHYQIFPDGKTVIVKLMSDEQQTASKAHLANASFSPEPPKPVATMQVDYRNGRLSITADKATLAQVLKEVQSRTGTDIPIPPGAAQEPIFAHIGPLPLRDALVSLLNGSRYNFILVDSDREPGKLKSVILTYRGSGGASQPAIANPQQPVIDSTPDADQQPMPPEVQPEQLPTQEGAPQQEAPPPPENTPPQM